MVIKRIAALRTSDDRREIREADPMITWNDAAADVRRPVLAMLIGFPVPSRSRGRTSFGFLSIHLVFLT